jgi:hypothetical protein
MNRNNGPTYNGNIYSFFFYFELRSLCSLGRRSTTWAMPQPSIYLFNPQNHPEAVDIPAV